MIRLRLCVLAALLASIGTTSAGAQTTQSSPEHARLAAMAGVWDVELTFWFRPGGSGIVSKGVSTIQPLFGGLFIEEKIRRDAERYFVHDACLDRFQYRHPPVRSHPHREHQHDSYLRDRRLRREHETVRAQG